MAVALDSSRTVSLELTFEPDRDAERAAGITNDILPKSAAFAGTCRCLPGDGKQRTHGICHSLVEALLPSTPAAGDKAASKDLNSIRSPKDASRHSQAGCWTGWSLASPPARCGSDPVTVRRRRP